MWFSKIAAHKNPGINELHEFIEGVSSFLNFTLKDNDISISLWNDDNRHLRDLALETFENDVEDASKKVHEAIESSKSDNLFKQRINEHGLFGRPMRFKLAVLDWIANEWQRAKDKFKDKIAGQFKIREWLKQMFEAIDAVLDSLIAAVGAGNLIKEFKDSLSALASS